MISFRINIKQQPSLKRSQELRYKAIIISFISQWKTILLAHLDTLKNWFFVELLRMYEGHIRHREISVACRSWFALKIKIKCALDDFHFRLEET